MVRTLHIEYDFSLKAAFIMYCLGGGGGGGGEDFINQYSIFSYPPAQFPKNFVSPREDGSDFVTPLPC